MHDLKFPELTTNRLRLECFGPQHSDGIFALWSSPEVCRYSGEAEDWSGRHVELPARGVEDSDKILDFFIRRAAQGTGVRWAMILRQTDHGGQSGQVIGAVGLNALAPRVELAFHLLPDHWGRGYATEACAAVIEWCVGYWPSCAIEAFVDDDNLASIRLAKRLGFEETSILRDGAKQYVFARRETTASA